MRNYIFSLAESKSLAMVPLWQQKHGKPPITDPTYATLWHKQNTGPNQISFYHFVITQYSHIFTLLSSACNCVIHFTHQAVLSCFIINNSMLNKSMNG
jgi:hypothetical protein